MINTSLLPNQGAYHGEDAVQIALTLFSPFIGNPVKQTLITKIRLSNSLSWYRSRRDNKIIVKSYNPDDKYPVFTKEVLDGWKLDLSELAPPRGERILRPILNDSDRKILKTFYSNKSDFTSKIIPNTGLTQLTNKKLKVSHRVTNKFYRAYKEEFTKKIATYGN